MAYQASRHKRIQEELELLDDKSTVIHTLSIDLDADTMAKQLSQKYLALVQAQKNLAFAQDSTEHEKKLELIGNTAIDLFEAVFGKENTEVIINFYENRYVEMCQEVLPFVTDIIIPKVRQVSQENKKQVLQNYNRKQRRKFGR